MQPQEIAINTLPFWSRFTLDADLRFDDANLLRTIFTRGTQIPVFDYRKGEDSAAALGGDRATGRDTILVNAAQTRGGGAYHIHGLSITKDGAPYVKSGTGQNAGLIHTLYPPHSLQPGNGASGPQVMTVEDFRALDAMMWQLFEKFFKIDLNIDGTRRILEMGPAPLYPGIGGPMNDIDTTNGGVWQSNYMHIKEGIKWNPSGTVDSNLTVTLTAAYDCRVPTWTAPDSLTPDGDPVTNPNPTAIGRLWTQGWIVNFHGYEESPTSNVS